MKNRMIPFILAVCSFVAAKPVQAQMGRMQVPTPEGIFNPVVGAGAQYEIDTQGAPKTNFEIAVVGKEAVGGKDGYWLETAMNGQMGDIYMKLLLVIDGANSHAEKMVMQMPGRPPMEMPVGGMGGRNPAASSAPKDIRDYADDLGSESVTVPAGTFTCEHYRAKNGDQDDVWVSKDAPPYGLVKMVNKTKNQTIVLTKIETNVQDKITGTPQEFNPMMMMGRGVQQPPQ